MSPAHLDSIACSQAPTKLTRRSTPRGRTGCGICRVRHVRCDETRPSCKNCVAAHRICEGYAPTQPQEPLAPLFSMKISDYAIPFRIPGSQLERRAFHYYCVRATNDVSGLINSDFWNRTVLQYSHQVPVIRQSLVALSTAHLEHATSDSTREAALKNVQSVRQYGKAVIQLRKLLATEQPSRTVVLICCLLMFAFEGVQGNFEVGIKHLESGLNILRMAVEEEAARGSALHHAEHAHLEELKDIFARHSFHATSHRVRSNRELLVGLDYAIPSAHTFMSLKEAQTALIKISNQAFNFIHGDCGMIYGLYDQMQHKSQILEQYDNWTSAISNFFSLEMLNRPAKDPEASAIQHAALNLQLNHRTVRMLVKFIRPFDPSVYFGPHNADVEECLDLATALLDKEQISDTSTAINFLPGNSHVIQNWSLEIGILIPLFTLALNLIDAEYYQRTVALLRRAAQRREGLRDGRDILAVLARVKGLLIPSIGDGPGQAKVGELVMLNLAAQRALASEGPAFAAWALPD